MSRYSVQKDGKVLDIVWRASRRFQARESAFEVWVGDTNIGDVTAYKPMDFQGWTAHAAFTSEEASGPVLLSGFHSRWYATEYLIGISPQFRQHERMEGGGFGLGTDGVLDTLATRLDSHRTEALPIERRGNTLIFRESSFVDFASPGVSKAMLEHRITVETVEVPGSRVES